MSETELRKALNFIKQHFFYVNPSSAATPDAILDIVKQLIKQHGINGVIIDPFNQLDSNQKSFQREDQYLSDVLTKFKRFACEYDLNFIVIAHPIKMQKDDHGEYKVPTQYDVAGGAMWNNKVDAIIVVHRPRVSSDATDPFVDIHVLKIKKQKLVGIPTGGKPVVLRYNYPMNRYDLQDGTKIPLILPNVNPELFNEL